MKYKTGALPAPIDERDYSVKVVRAVFPAEYELDMGEPYLQKYSTCFAQAARKLYAKNFGIEFGTAWLYGIGRSNGRKTEGLYSNEAAQAAVTFGLAPLVDDPQEREVTNVITYAQYAHHDRLLAAAAPYKGGSWARVYTEMEIKAAIMTGLPVIVCTGLETQDPDSSGVWRCRKWGIGYHAQLAYGWKIINGEEMAVVLNSWDDDWGIDGHSYIPWMDIVMWQDCIAFTLPKPEHEERESIIFQRTLKRGMEGNDVKRAQDQLIAHGYEWWLLPHGADGKYGAKTENAVVAFQKKQGLDITGMVDKNTWLALEDEYIAPIPDEPTAPSVLAAELVAWCESKVGNAYVWGGNGQSDLTDAWIYRMDTKGKAYAEKSIKYVKTMREQGAAHLEAYDCSGLISKFLQTKGLVTSKRNCDHLWAFCKPVDRAALIAGDLLFRGSDKDKTHVGVYVGHGWVVEAQGRSYGVVKRPINAGGSDYWEYFGRLELEV